MKNVQLITDGACIGNPGPGGWACILRDGTEVRELSGSEAQTTNNGMELTAARRSKPVRFSMSPCESFLSSRIDCKRSPISTFALLHCL